MLKSILHSACVTNSRVLEHEGALASAHHHNIWVRYCRLLRSSESSFSLLGLVVLRSFMVGNSISFVICLALHWLKLWSLHFTLISWYFCSFLAKQRLFWRLQYILSKFLMSVLDWVFTACNPERILQFFIEPNGDDSTLSKSFDMGPSLFAPSSLPECVFAATAALFISSLIAVLLFLGSSALLGVSSSNSSYLLEKLIKALELAGVPIHAWIPTTEAEQCRNCIATTRHLLVQTVMNGSDSRRFFLHYTTHYLLLLKTVNVVKFWALLKSRKNFLCSFMMQVMLPSTAKIVLRWK